MTQTSTTQRPRARLTTLAALLVSSTAAVVFADEGYNSPGNTCVEVADLSPETVYAGNASALNATTSSNIYNCPVLRRAPDTSIFGGGVFVAGPNPASATCQFVSCTPGGLSCSFAPIPQPFNGNPAVVSGRTDGFGFIDCVLPARQSVGAEYQILHYAWID